jgi:hydroxymethylpyrimidine pyrophosphatase-like HAD family hydrolase
MIIAVDFDGTCVTHEYPLVGKEIGAVNVLRKLVDKGHLLILYTMRSGKELNDAKQWFIDRKIPLYGVQFNPQQSSWTSSNKCYAQLYIDDAALGCPLVHGMHNRPYVDWQEVDKYFNKVDVIK